MTRDVLNLPLPPAILFVQENTVGTMREHTQHENTIRARMQPSSRSQLVVFVAAALERGGENQWAMLLNTEVAGGATSSGRSNSSI